MSKLKRKKDRAVSPDTGSRPPHGGGSSLRCSSTGSWFDEIELTAAERMWRQVLKAANPSLTDLGWEVVPCLPECDNKSLKKSCKEVNEHEVFSIGQETFQWLPFPTDFPGHTSFQDDCGSNIQDNPAPRNQSKDPSLHDCCIVSSKDDHGIPQPVVPVKSRHTVDVVKQSTPIPKKVHSKKVKKPVPSGSQTLTNLYSTKRAECNKSQGLFPDPNGKREPEIKDVVMTDTAEVVEPCCSRAQEVEEETHRPAMDSLDSCPICLKEFPEGLSQLDIDSHLAQCLSESTVDIMW